MAKWLNGLILPPVVMVVCATGMLVTQWLMGARWQEGDFVLLGAGGIAVIATVIMLSGSLPFLRAGTTLHPQKPQQVNVLIISGIFHFSRNPIYLGQVLLLAAWALVLGGISVWLWWLLFFAYLDSVQIPREEAFLHTRFGEAYEAYSQRVRRWL